MKKLIGLLSLLVLFGYGAQAMANTPVFSANGFTCGKKGITVTCKGPAPNGKDMITGTGHDLVYLTINTITEGAPSRFTYFSDTGCLIGYAFNAAGNPIKAVASHRDNVTQTFEFGEGKYDAVIEFCSSTAPKGAKTAQVK